MKASDTWAAATLVRARRRFKVLEKAMAVTRAGSYSDGHRGFEMQAGDVEEGGVQTGEDGTAYVTVDRETGLLIAAAAKRIIAERLKALGVRT